MGGILRQIVGQGGMAKKSPGRTAAEPGLKRPLREGMMIADRKGNTPVSRGTTKHFLTFNAMCPKY
jgi:hypothetical protein